MAGGCLLRRLGRQLPAGSVWSMPVVVVRELGEDLGGVGCVHDEDVVEGFAEVCPVCPSALTGSGRDRQVRGTDGAGVGQWPRVLR